MERYDLTAHLYDMRYAEEQSLKVEEALKRVKLGDESFVLDVGCGTGLLFDYVAGKASIVVGVDLSRNLLLKAKKRAEKFSNVHLVLADADYMPFISGFFSHLFAVTVLQNMPCPEKTLTEAKRVTAENAVMVITGLKKKFGLRSFLELLSRVNLKVVGIADGQDNLKCYVAVCMKI